MYEWFTMTIVSTVFMIHPYSTSKMKFTVYTARRYASAVYAVIMCLSVRPSVRLSVISRWSTETAEPRIAKTTPHSRFYSKNIGEIPTG